MRNQSAKSGVWLLGPLGMALLGVGLVAAGCGGADGEVSTARAEVGSTGGEPPRARFDREASLSREEIAREVPPGEMPETAVVAQVGGASPTAQAQETTSCPADLEGLEVSVASVPDGGALILRVAESDAERLRARMRLFAKVHEVHTLERPGAQRFSDPDAPIHQASEVRVIDTPEGVRLEVHAGDAAQASALREELRADAEQLRAGNCPLALSIES